MRCELLSGFIASQALGSSNGEHCACGMRRVRAWLRVAAAHSPGRNSCDGCGGAICVRSSLRSPSSPEAWWTEWRAWHCDLFSEGILSGSRVPSSAPAANSNSQWCGGSAFKQALRPTYHTDVRWMGCICTTDLAVSSRKLRAYDRIPIYTRIAHT
ncbi:hypothetical protein OH77DRAFT_67702 [Trametes cingulata]|nr:hypothetical protein OH77DRAFT_67702 [Trametes cingulata]